ncbi:PaaI family thioesterase [Colwellia sp. 20A7]|uniref:PaaI family thioesterase n=1 Tax=Colwellia sp. 20A7 TaxID=2689569 RepID=UPI00135A6DF1|nr:PaaI family thioesterase [Colwellia sp. 20A7]
MKSKEQIIEKSNRHAAKYTCFLGGKLVDIDTKKNACTYEYNISKDYCHSIDVVQGGFITAMLDTAMSQPLIVAHPDMTHMSSLEIKTNYLEPTRAGKLRVEGCVIKNNYPIIFMEGRIYNEDNVLTATASSVGKIKISTKQ